MAKTKEGGYSNNTRITKAKPPHHNVVAKNNPSQDGKVGPTFRKKLIRRESNNQTETDQVEEPVPQHRGKMDMNTQLGEAKKIQISEKNLDKSTLWKSISERINRLSL